MDRSVSGRLSRVLSIIAVICVGFYFSHSKGLIQKRHGLQSKIDQLKERLRKAEEPTLAAAGLVITIPRNMNGTVFEVPHDDDIRLWCAFAAPILAESCAKEIAE